MRRRLLLSMVGIAVIAVALVGAPLAYVLDHLANETVQIRLEREATGIALALEAQLDAGRLPSSKELDQLTPDDDHTVVALDGVGVVDGGESVSGRALRSEVHVAPGATVQVQAPAQPVNNQVQGAVLILLGVAVVGTAVAAALAVLQGRRLARPLEALASTSRRLGRGDFSATAPRSGIPEIDDVAAALDAGSARVGRLLRAEREFSANASHQLRTALTGVSLHLEAIAGSDDPEVRAEAGDALKQIDRLTNVIDELLRLARLGRSGERREVNLTALASEHVADWAGRFVRKRRDLVLDAPPRALVTTTPGAVGQTLDILLSNALVHGAGSTIVRVDVQSAGADIVVTDEGRAVAPDAQGRVFERAATTDGHGLGLALARELVTAEGGSLELVGAAAFRIRIPVGVVATERNDVRENHDQPVSDS